MPASDLLTDPLLVGVPVREGRKLLVGVELERKLGQGGMGAVYKGRHLRLDVDVAVKVMTPPPGLSPGHSSDEAESFVKRFIREARTAAKIDHANLVRVFDVDSEHGLYFIVMQYVDGESAAERLARKGPLSEGEAGRIALAAATGLAEAHKKGIVHRDVKPANILVDRKTGRVKVADLGLAKAYAGDKRAEEPFTTTHGTVGTAPYMSPEQTRSARDVGPRADVWSLGVTLYQLLTGKLPFYDEDRTDLIMKIRNAPAPDILSLHQDLSEGIRDIIDRALKKNHAERFPDCGEMAKALRAHVRELTGRDAIPSWAPSSRRSPPEGTLSLFRTSPPDPAARPVRMPQEGGVSMLSTSPSDNAAKSPPTPQGSDLSQFVTSAPDESAEAPPDFESHEVVPRDTHFNPLLIIAKLIRAKRDGDSALLDEAMRECNRAIECDATNSEAYCCRGEVKEATGDYHGAIMDYDEAIKIRPDDDATCFFRGRSKKAEGDEHGAMGDFKLTIQLSGDDERSSIFRDAAKRELGHEGAADAEPAGFRQWMLQCELCGQQYDAAKMPSVRTGDPGFLCQDCYGKWMLSEGPQ